MQVRAGSLQRINGPVPTVGRLGRYLGRYLGRLVGLEDLRDQRLGIVRQTGPPSTSPSSAIRITTER